MFLSFALLAASVLPASQRTAESVDAMQAAASAGNWPRLEALSKVALAKNKRDSLAWTFAGLAHDHLGELPAALHDFAEAVRLSPNERGVHNNYGASLEENGKKSEAMAEYRASLKIDPQQPSALVNLARLLAASGQPPGEAEAQTLLQSAWNIAPDAEIARSLFLLQPCAKQKSQNMSPDSNSTAYATSIVQNAASASSEQREILGRALVRCGYSEQAIAYYDSLSREGPLSEANSLGKASAQLALNRPEEAGRTLETAIRDGQKSPSLFAELSDVYSQTGHPDQAVTAMRIALQLDPNNEKTVYRYGLLLLDIPAPKAAEMRVKEALDRNGRSAALWFLLGLSQFDQTELVPAEASFDRSIALRPDFAPALAYRGLCSLDQMDYSSAAGWYRKAIAADSAAGDLHLLLAEALEKQSGAAPSQIRAELEKGIALDPKLASAYLALGRLNLKERQPEAAVQAFETALKLDSKQRQAHFYLARAYSQLHNSTRSAEEANLFKDQESAAQSADRSAIQEAMRKLARTQF